MSCTTCGCLLYNYQHVAILQTPVCDSALRSDLPTNSQVHLKALSVESEAQRPDNMSRVSDTSMVTKKLTSRQQLSLLLKDNQWHYFKTEPTCECSTCENAVERLYVRIRPDGRLLAISEADAFNWYGVELGSGDTSNLLTVGTAGSKQ